MQGRRQSLQVTRGSLLTPQEIKPPREQPQTGYQDEGPHGEQPSLGEQEQQEDGRALAGAGKGGCGDEPEARLQGHPEQLDADQPAEQDSGDAPARPAPALPAGTQGGARGLLLEKQDRQGQRPPGV